MTNIVDLTHIDGVAFVKEIDALRAELLADLGADDLTHLRKMIWWGRLCSAAGYLTAWLGPNPLSALLLSQGTMFRWIVMHHISHRGYDRVPGVPDRLTSSQFAQGWRRYIDWFDWICPKAWAHEHNSLHHMYTGQESDPDLVERNIRAIRSWNVPMFVKDGFLLALACSWKIIYYVPSTVREWHRLKCRRAAHRGVGADECSLCQSSDVRTRQGRAQWKRIFNPRYPEGLQLWGACILPYLVIKFGIIPFLFGLLLGPAAWTSVFINSLIAEVFTNIHAFLTIVPNHTGEDVPRFEGTTRGKSQWYIRQVVGSVNYNGGSDLPDFLQGYLNYQIEHHIWPDLPMRKYQQAQPRLEAICRKYGVPYIRENIWKRVVKTVSVITGRTSMAVGNMNC